LQDGGKLQRRLGFWSLTAAAVGGVIGSGWLFGAMYAAKAAGPESVVAWIVGGFAMLLVALVFGELAMVKPEAGGLVRYPQYTNGSLVATLAGWAMWLGFVANPPTEAAGVVQYASKFWPALYVHSHLTIIGILVAVLLMMLFVVVNYFGVHIFARSNTTITVIKFIVPSLTLIALLFSGFHPANFTQHGGFAPYGWSAALSSIATSGIIFAYTGFRNPIDLGGEAKNPRKTIPAALITSILVSIVLYIGLELAFVGALPIKMLASGWHGIQLNSPFADLAMAINLMWLYWILMADSMISPAGSSFVYTAANARNIYALSKNGIAPKYFLNIHKQFGVPTRALILNFLVGLLYLFPLKSWHSIISITGVLAVFTFSAGPVSVMVFRRVGLTTKTLRFKGMNWIAPVAFVVSSLIVFWVPWPALGKSWPIMLLGFIIYVVTHFAAGRQGKEWSGGLWMMVYVLFLYAFSSIGSFKGAGWISAPWDSVIVAVVSLAIFYWGVSSGVRYMHATGEIQELVDDRDSMIETGGEIDVRNLGIES
jgi:amino acid transporter